jgi:RNA polymerase sigma factor (sigma-70 family)
VPQGFPTFQDERRRCGSLLADGVDPPGFDDSWRAAAGRGDSAAFGALYDRLGTRLLAVARGLCGAHADPEDLVQQTFLDLYRSRRALARSRDVESYAFASLRHRAAAAARRRRPASLEIEPGAEDPVPHESDARLERALSALPAEQREALELRTAGGLTFEQLGAVLGVSADTAASRVRYALERLRRSLGGDV